MFRSAFIVPIRVLSWATLLAASLVMRHLSFAAQPSPNIIIILADDLGYGDLGSYGQRDIPTPHLDIFAARGTRFTNAYAGAPVCAPSRSVLLTGKHAGRTSVRGNRRKGQSASAVALHPTDFTLAKLLKDSGYITASIGKWGLGESEGEGVTGLPLRHGFDSFYGYLNHWHAHNAWSSFIWRNESKEMLRNIVPDEDERGAGVATTMIDFIPRLCVEEAVKFIQTPHQAPFFLYLAITPPHVNNERRPMGLEIENESAFADQPWPPAMRAYAELISMVDRTVAGVVNALAETGQTDNTLILFTSDNGPHRENGGNPAFFNSSGSLRGYKRFVYEGGIRVPAIAVWPGHIPSDVTSDLIWSFEDIMPTLAAVAGSTSLLPSGITGLDLSPAWTGGEVPATQVRFLYWEFHEGGFKQSARHGDWKAVRMKLNQPLELYFLPTDPAEARNVAADNPAIVTKFESFFATARTDSPYWIPDDPSTR